MKYGILTIGCYVYKGFRGGWFYRLLLTADVVATETLFGFKDDSEDEILWRLDRLAGVVFYFWANGRWASGGASCRIGERGVGILQGWFGVIEFVKG